MNNKNKECKEMNVTISEKFSNVEDKSAVNYMKFIISMININEILKFYKIPTDFSFCIESMDDALIYLEFVTSIFEGIDMRDFLGIRSIIVFRTIKFCIRHELDYSQIVETYDMDGNEFAEAECDDYLCDVINESIATNNEDKFKNDFPFMFGIAKDVILFYDLIIDFAHENRNPVFLKCNKNTFFVNRLENLIRIQFDMINTEITTGKIGGFAYIKSEFNKDIIFFHIIEDKMIGGLTSSYEQMFDITTSVINLEEEVK